MGKGEQTTDVPIEDISWNTLLKTAILTKCYGQKVFAVFFVTVFKGQSEQDRICTSPFGIVCFLSQFSSNL